MTPHNPEGTMSQTNLPASRVSYSIEEFAALTGLGRTRVFAEMKLGRLHAVKAGRRTLIPAAEVERWLAALDVRKAG